LHWAASYQNHSRTDSGPILPLTTLCLPPPASPLRHPHVIAESSPHQHPTRHCSELSAMSSVHVGHSPAAHVIIPYPTPPDDVIRKNAPKAKFPYLAQNHGFFALFAKESIVRPA